MAATETRTVARPSRRDAIQELRSMGLTPVVTPDGCWLECDGERLPLGADPDWRDAVGRGHAWLESLGEAAGEAGRRLAERRRGAGFSNLGDFAEFSALDEGQVFEAEAGLSAPQPVHLRILDWLEAGQLSTRG